MEPKKFEINSQSVNQLKKLLDEYKLNECNFTLDALIRYAESRLNVLTIKLTNPNLTPEEKNAILRKILVAERKFRHMLDVPMLCIKRIETQKYPHEQAILLTIIGILHDIGRIDEIISQTEKTTFKLKVDHSLIGANFLVSNDRISDDDHIYEFVTKSLISEYWEVIKNCVRYHSSLVVPEDTFSTELEKSLIHDIRLIDKSSIMNSFLYEDIQSVIGITPIELAQTHITDATFEELINEQPVNRKKPGEEYTPNRHFMSHVGFIYDMDDYSMLTDNWVSKYLKIYMPTEEKDQLRKDIIERCAVRRLLKYNR